MNALDRFLLDAYLEDSLDAEQTEAFELMMLARPDLADAVEADSALRIGLLAAQETPVQSLPSASRPQAEAAAPSPQPPASPQRSATRSRRRWPMALAASCSLLAGATAGWWLRAPDGDPQSATLVYVDTLRNIAQPGVLQLPEAGAVVLLAPVASSTPCRAELRLRQPGRPDIAVHADPDEFGYASLILPRTALRPGEATVLVSCEGQNLAQYPVRLAVREQTREGG